MTTQTNEQRVKDVWPDAVCHKWPDDEYEFIYTVFVAPSTLSHMLSMCLTEQLAWQSAADNLTDKSKGDV